MGESWVAAHSMTQGFSRRNFTLPAVNFSAPAAVFTTSYSGWASTSVGCSPMQVLLPLKNDPEFSLDVRSKTNDRNGIEHTDETPPTPDRLARNVRDDKNHSVQRTMRADHGGADANAEILTGVGLVLATLVALGLGLLLVWFATLRENQVFWTNAGGYPIWLRDLVCWTYLPLFVGVGLSLMLLSMACFSRICRSIRFMAVEGILLLACWALLATSGYIAFANNVMNLIEGRDLHHHDR